MNEILVHAAGTKVVVDRENNRIGTLYPKEKQVREWCDLTDPIWQKYLNCRVCQKPLDDERLAWAFWKHESQVCSPECFSNETFSKYACCEKAVRVNCVCVYSTECPEHGRRCHGSHD